MGQIRIEKVSITDTGTECIVNAANEQLQGGSGVCGAIFKAAGWNKLQTACDAIGRCDTGSAVITPAFNINANYIIHAVGPVWHGGNRKEPQKLYGCYLASLNLAMENGCHSIAFPLISSGIFGYPKDKAWRKALQACNDFIKKNPDYDMDILFSVLDDRILKMGRDELNKLKNQDSVRHHPKEDILLEKLDGKALRTAIEAVGKVVKVKWMGGPQEDGTVQMPYPDYPAGVWDSFSIIEEDMEYQAHYKKYCHGVLPTEMNVQQIRTMLTYMGRGERFCDGLVAEYLGDKTLLKLLLRLDDFLIRYYEKHKLPSGLRYQNPVFWFEMKPDNTPVLVKGNGEKMTISQKSDMFDQSVQSQQGWQRSMLYMDYIGEWDATAFACTMSTTMSYGPDEDGKTYTFTSCQEAERRLYKRLVPEQVEVCRKNVADFYSDPNLQMEWKDIILHPVCVILKSDGSIEPAIIRKLDSGILVKFQQGTTYIEI